MTGLSVQQACSSFCGLICMSWLVCRHGGRCECSCGPLDGGGVWSARERSCTELVVIPGQRASWHLCCRCAVGSERIRLYTAIHSTGFLFCVLTFPQRMLPALVSKFSKWHDFDAWGLIRAIDVAGSCYLLKLVFVESWTEYDTCMYTQINISIQCFGDKDQHKCIFSHFRCIKCAVTRSTHMTSTTGGDWWRTPLKMVSAQLMSWPMLFTNTFDMFLPLTVKEEQCRRNNSKVITCSITCMLREQQPKSNLKLSPPLLPSPPGLAKFFHNGVSLRKDAVSASICRVQRILRWFESQHQLTFYASSLLFVYEGLPSSSSTSSFSSPFSTPSISPNAGNTAMLSSAADGGQGGEGKARQEGVGQEEEVAEYNNNNIQVSVPWDFSLATIYTNHTKGGHHHCAKGHLHGNSGDDDAVEITVSSVSGDNISALCEEDNSAWKRTGESQKPPNGNGNKSQLEGKDEDGEREDSGRRSRREEEKLKGRGGATEGSGGDTKVEVRMIDFAHVFPSEGHDYGYIYGLKHLLTVLEHILCEAAWSPHSSPPSLYLRTCSVNHCLPPSTHFPLKSWKPSEDTGTNQRSEY